MSALRVLNARGVFEGLRHGQEEPLDSSPGQMISGAGRRFSRDYWLWRTQSLGTAGQDCLVYAVQIYASRICP